MARTEAQREAERRYYAKNRNKKNAKSSQFFKDNPDYKRIRRSQIKAYVQSVKLMHGCSVCGYKEHPAALDFHHTDDDKEVLVGQADSIRKAEEEMAKCIVLCANCHRVHHAENRKAPFAIPVNMQDDGLSIL